VDDAQADCPELMLRRVRIHGHTRAFVMTGQGPTILLLHGIGMSHTTWNLVIPKLARNFTVIAPDLLGHGESDKPRADYSIGGYANAMRDLLLHLGIPSATVVGHSLGGGIAMQFAYQYPQMTERIVLVASGGLGRSVSPVIRAFTIPGTGPILAVAAHGAVRSVTMPVLERLAGSGLPGTQDLHGMIEVYDSLADKRSRAPFRHVLRAAVDWRGQVITMIDRAYLAQHLPAMVVWGARDMVIPVKHAYAAKELLPAARLEVFADAGHMPHEDFAEHFSDVMTSFVLESAAATYDEDDFRRLLHAGAAPRRRRPAYVRLPKQPNSVMDASGN
jgi:pimeloyl-ACP methyl ester carboxylesterase